MLAADRRALLMQHPYVDLPLVNGWAKEAMKAGRLAPVRMTERNAVWSPRLPSAGAGVADKRQEPGSSTTRSA